MSLSSTKVSGTVSKRDERREVTVTQQPRGRIQRHFPGFVTKLVARISSSRSNLHNTAIVAKPDDSVNSQIDVNGVVESGPPNLVANKHDPGPAVAMEEDGPSIENQENVGKDESRHSTSSASSDIVNKHQRHVWLTDASGQRFDVGVQFDTETSSNFITRIALNMIGTLKEYEIPLEAQRPCRSPIAPDMSIIMMPVSFVYAQMENGELGFHHRKVKLKIIEDPVECEVIIGRNTMEKSNQSEEITLLKRLDNSKEIMLSDGTSLSVPLRTKPPRTKEEEAMYATSKDRIKHEIDQAFSEQQSAPLDLLNGPTGTIEGTESIHSIYNTQYSVAQTFYTART